MYTCPTSPTLTQQSFHPLLTFPLPPPSTSLTIPFSREFFIDPDETDLTFEGSNCEVDVEAAVTMVSVSDCKYVIPVTTATTTTTYNNNDNAVKMVDVRIHLRYQTPINSTTTVVTLPDIVYTSTSPCPVASKNENLSIVIPSGNTSDITLVIALLTVGLVYAVCVIVKGVVGVVAREKKKVS
jgi:hypothetical protein